MSTAAQQDIEIKQNAGFEMVMNFLDDAGGPIDISNWTFTGQVRKRYSDLKVIATFFFEIHDAPEVGSVSCKLTPVSTGLIPVDPASSSKQALTEMIYDIFASKNGGSADCVMEGAASIIPSVTRRC